MLADLSLEAVFNPCARGGLLDCTNTHVLSSPDAIARAIVITMKKALRKSVRCPASQDTAEGNMMTPVKKEEESKTQPASPLSPVLDITSSPSFGNAKDDNDDDDNEDNED
eukprot:9536394-Ditylum_brightwellii.AAC.1